MNKKKKKNIARMRKYIVSLVMLLMCMTEAVAQSSMTDDQVIRFVVKEQKAGSSQQEIAMKLVQRGVTTEQIKRVQKKVERLKKDKGLGAVADKTLGGDENGRGRRNNGDAKKRENTTSQKIKDMKKKRMLDVDDDEEVVSKEKEDALDAQEVAMWAAAWQATIDPDMYQIYYSDVVNGPSEGAGKNPLGGPAQGGSNYRYGIADAELDELIMEARSSTDQAYRKAMYKACLDMIIDWAVEVPTYQRQNAIIFSAERVNLDTVTPDITTFYGWMNEVQNIELN